MSEHPVCETCLFYVGDTIDGTCRRYPPSKYDPKTGRWSSPSVNSYHFCGEWKPLQIKDR